ncbi:MAG: radical SAM family heme chaperone HemW, partial [Desulfobacteraceae bacterium]|nr:radical SAM family heme chaperone HemW [Desulfobacteraceae bacterium]
MSLYIHVPFCKKKCPYCDFFSVTDLSVVPAYVQGLCKEIRLRSNMTGSWSQKRVHTIYFGGGTPSLLSVDQVRQILDTIQDCFCLVFRPEITFEVNPGTVDTAFLTGLKHLGVNRLSIGAQSFDPAKLSFLCRIHTREQVFDTLAGAARAGFCNLGLDLMYGLPEETPDVWQQDLEIALAFKTAHLSCYMLTIEPGTVFFDQHKKGQLCPCDRDRRMDFFVQTAEVLESFGYIHYEVSNFALGRENESIHNSHYWNRGAYLGMGPSAHSFVPLYSGDRSGVKPYPAPVRFSLEPDGPTRFWNVADVQSWLDCLAAGRLPLAGHEILAPAQEVLEQVMLGLRTEKGIAIKGLGRDLHALVARLEDRGIGEMYLPDGTADTSDRFRLTRSGMVCLDSIV